jgi:hypothetical protein
MAYPPPIRPGLGTPHPGNPGQGGYGPPGGSRGFVREVKTTKVFVGSISPGITDATLEELLNVRSALLGLSETDNVGMWATTRAQESLWCQW